MLKKTRSNFHNKEGAMKTGSGGKTPFFFNIHPAGSKPTRAIPLLLSVVTKVLKLTPVNWKTAGISTFTKFVSKTQETNFVKVLKLIPVSTTGGT
jgi:hypothetical protein